MLKLAYKYSDDVISKYLESLEDEHFKYFNTTGWNEYNIINNDNFNNIQYVSVDNNDNVIGIIFFEVNRYTKVVTNIGIINFEKRNNITFSKDVLKAIDKVFSIGFNKMEWNVVTENTRAMNIYDKFINTYGGLEVGILHETIMIEGKMYDKKLYELSKSNWTKNYRRR